MWKISQIYLSDFRAGDNYMDDGLIKALDDSGESRDCLIFSPNGTFKTSLLSIVLSQLSPGKDRFIQTLQSSSKKIEDYVIMQRPALVMTKFVSSSDQASLFGETDADSLVIGQLLFLRPSASANNKHELERLFFMGRSGSVFDQVRQLFLSLRAERTGWDQLRREIATFTEVEETQRDWLKKLDTAGLDPFLVDKQVEMCKEEGGIANTLRFSDEKAFMSFFLNATMDIKRSGDLYENIRLGMDKHRNIPQRKRELTAANRLISTLQSHESTAGKWRKLESDRQTHSSHIGEAAHILALALPQAKKAREKVKEKADEIDRQRSDTNRTQQEALADKNLINQEKLRRQHEEFSAEFSKCTQQIQLLKTERIALEGSALFSEVDIRQQKLTTAERALDAASSELAPMKTHLNGTQAAYHVRLTHEKSQLEKKKRSKEVDLNAGNEKKEALGKRLKEIQGDLGASQRREDVVKSNIDAAEKAVKSLALEGGERPQEALIRLQDEQKMRESQIMAVMDRRRTDQQAVEQLQILTQQQVRQKDESQRKVDNIAHWLAEEKQARAAVLSNEFLVVIAGSKDFNPYTAELSSLVNDALNRSRINEDQQNVNVLKLQEELKQLMGVKTESEDSLTGNLRKYYIEKGVAEARLRSFGEYLDSLFDGNIEKIAELMRADPARFGGLVAMDQETLKQVAEIETPDWLVRPIIISLAGSKEEYDNIFRTESTDKNDNIRLVIEPKDLTVYSLLALERRREDLSKEREQAIASREKAKKKLEDLKRSDELRVQLLSNFVGPDHIEAQRQEEETLLKAIANNISALEQYEKEIAEKKAAIEESEQLECELRDKKEAVGRALDRVENWICLYADLDLWRTEVDELATGIVEKTEIIRSLEAQLHALDSQINELLATMQDCSSQLEHLAANESVPAPTGDVELPELPGSNLFVLQQAYYEADRALSQAETKNGVSALGEKLRTAKIELGDVMRQWESYHDQNHPDMALVEKWQAVSCIERGKAKSEIAEQLINDQSNEKTLLGKLEENSRKHEDARERLRKHCRSQKVEPSLDTAAIREQSIEVLQQQAGSRYERAANECKRLDERAIQLRADTEQVQDWERKLNLASAWVGGHPATAPSDENEFYWPLLTVGQIEDRVRAGEKFEAMVKDLREQLDAIDRQLEKERRHIDSGFAQIKRQIEDKSIADSLFKIVQKMLNTDSRSFAYQTADYIAKCDKVVRNLKVEIESMNNHVSSLVNSLIDHATDCYQVLTSAGNAVVPDIVPVYGGETILRVKARLDFVKHREAYREAMQNWFFDVVEKGNLPQANVKKGDELGASLLYRLLACTGKRVRDGFEIELLKMAGQTGRYVPIHKDLSSGGEGLTSATMLYSVISHIRSRQRQHIAEGNSVGFLFMDNPLSKASKASFVHAQLRTCVAFGIQPIFVTGVGDIEALEQFSNRIVVTKSDGNDGRSKHLKINNEVFSRVVITEELLTEEAV